MSLSLDMTTMFSNATLIVNALWPIVALGVGFTLGFAILKMIQQSIKGAL
jgi:hypothetical protein